jgi:hypothetical protein
VAEADAESEKDALDQGVTASAEQPADEDGISSSPVIWANSAPAFP